MSNTKAFIQKAKEIIDEATSQGITIRLMGGAAVWSLTEAKNSTIQKGFEQHRQLKDVDFMAYSNQWDKVVTLFSKMGYEYDRRHAALHGQTKIIFTRTDRTEPAYVDVMFDKFEYCHKLDFTKNGGRLERFYPAIAPTYLLLQKLQIVEINEKDVIDAIIILGTHDVGVTGIDSIDCEYMKKLLSNDWGFYFTVTSNLKRIATNLKKYQSAGYIKEGDAQDVNTKINMMIKSIDSEPKTLKWRARSRIGTSKKWYRDVEEVLR